MSLDTYDLLNSIATALVFVGVAGESCPEFFNFPKEVRLQKLLTKTALILLILGLAGELWTGCGASRATKIEVASMNKDAQAAIAQAAQASARAATANDDEAKLKRQNLDLERQLEEERLQRLRLARNVAQRHFLYQAVWPKLKPFAGTDFAVWSVEDPEAERLGGLIDETLRTAQWVSVSQLMIEQNVAANDEGVFIELPYGVFRPNAAQLDQQRKTSKAAWSLAETLANNNIGAFITAGENLAPGTIRIRVHFQPDPKSTQVMVKALRQGLRKFRESQRTER